MHIAPKNRWKVVTGITLLIAAAMWGILALTMHPAQAPKEDAPIAVTGGTLLDTFPAKEINSRTLATPQEKIDYVSTFLPMSETIWETEFFITEKTAEIALVVDRDALDAWHAGLENAAKDDIPDTLWKDILMVNLGFPENIERKRYMSADGNIKMLQIPEYQIVMIWMEQ